MHNAFHVAVHLKIHDLVVFRLMFCSDGYVSSSYNDHIYILDTYIVNYAILFYIPVL